MYESETLQFWEKLFKENSRQIVNDKSHYRKKYFILKKLAKFYIERMINV